MKVITSLGAGVQSTVIALGFTEEFKIPYLHKTYPQGTVVIFSDTGSERPETYEYLNDIIIPILKRNDIEFHNVSRWTMKITDRMTDIESFNDKSLYDYYYRKKMIPFRKARTCTEKYKVQPIKQLINKLFPEINHKKPIIQLLGITTDEHLRMKPNKVKYIKNVFPLIDMGLSRKGLTKYYEKWGLEIPIKSGCYCCPFQTQKQLEHTYRKHPQLIEMTMALEERAIKADTKQTNYEMKLLSYGKTVRQVVDDIENQQSLDDWFNLDQDECEGACFL